MTDITVTTESPVEPDYTLSIVHEDCGYVVYEGGRAISIAFMNETEAKNWADYHEGFNQQVCFVCGSGISKSDDPWYGYSVSSKGVDWVHTSCCTKFHFWCDTASPCSGRVPSLKFLDKFWAEHHGALDIPASRPELFRVHSI